MGLIKPSYSLIDEDQGEVAEHSSNSNDGGESPENSYGENGDDFIAEPNDDLDNVDSYSDQIENAYAGYVERAVQELPADASVKEIVEKAWEIAFEEREQSTVENQEFLRDIEYFALGVHAAVSRDPMMNLLCALAPAYELAKQLAIGFKNQGFPVFELFLRADKAQPITEPGWRLDAWRGLREGWFGSPLHRHSNEKKRSSNLRIKAP